ncbi:DUF7697 family protein [Pseudorhodobacter antarcticus]|uniref:DUF7697 family protein n=1 Tax=Pseudorhodobacter antarcticus TaxID=1077947 RepID=UPI003AF3D7B4
MTALADWVFGGGERYCAACEGHCEDCPQILNAPHTHEGWQVWDLAQRLGGQIRAIPGAILGWDMTAALAMATALGISPRAVVELLPVIEAAMVRGVTKQNSQADISGD